MYDGQIVFAQLMEFVPRRPFDNCVRRYRGQHRVRRFSCRDQFLCMAFAQLTGRDSLRDIETSLRAMSSKLYHAGFPVASLAAHSPRPTKGGTGASGRTWPRCSSATRGGSTLRRPQAQR